MTNLCIEVLFSDTTASSNTCARVKKFPSPYKETWCIIYIDCICFIMKYLQRPTFLLLLWQWWSLYDRIPNLLYGSLLSSDMKITYSSIMHKWSANFILPFNRNESESQKGNVWGSLWKRSSPVGATAAMKFPWKHSLKFCSGAMNGRSRSEGR